jgi:hypothetical protein
MPSASIERDDGTKITVELSNEQVDALVEIIGDACAEPGVETAGVRLGTKKTPSAKGLLLALRDEGYLEQGRSIAHLQKEMQRKGYRYEITSLSGPLRDLVREGKLRREGDPGKFRYYEPA